MKRIFVVTILAVLCSPPFLWAVSKGKIDDRLEECGPGNQRSDRTSVPHSAAPAEQSSLRDRHSVSAQGCVWLWRKLWPWSHELP